MDPDIIRVSDGVFKLFWREWMIRDLMACGANERVARLLLDCGITWSRVNV